MKINWEEHQRRTRASIELSEWAIKWMESGLSSLEIISLLGLKIAETAKYQIREHKDGETSLQATPD